MTPATLGYVIRHVPDVARSARFYQAVFGLTARLIHESGSYIELDTGTTTLAFATPGLIRELGVDPGTAGETPPFGTELAFVVPDAEVEATVAADGELRCFSPPARAAGARHG